jgi:hypothetical protein
MGNLSLRNLIRKATMITSENGKDPKDPLNEVELEARRLAVRENAKHVLRESGLAEMLRSINKDLLKGRGRFEEYDSMVLFKWGSGYTRRHIWVEINGNTIRFRLAPHRKCAAPVPACDGEYHIFTSSMWADRELLRTELYKYYAKPVAESSDD